MSDPGWAAVRRRKGSTSNVPLLAMDSFSHDNMLCLVTKFLSQPAAWYDPLRDQNIKNNMITTAITKIMNFFFDSIGDTSLIY